MRGSTGKIIAARYGSWWVATFEDEDLWPLILAEDRASYIDRCVEHKRTTAGFVPTRAVASRWFNVATIIRETGGDTWIHREKNELWWTTSRDGELTATLEPAHETHPPGAMVYVLTKPTEAWTNRSRTGQRLDWNMLHPKAREFLFTESTMQQLSQDNAAYALALRRPRTEAATLLVT